MRDAGTVISLETVPTRPIPVLAVLLMMSGALACSHATQADTGSDWSTEVIPRNASALPVGAHVTVELDQPISATSRPGEPFTMHSTQPVIALDRSIVVPDRALVFGHVAGIGATRDSTPAALVRLEFDSLRFGGHRHPFSAIVVRTAIPDGDSVALPARTKMTLRATRRIDF